MVALRPLAPQLAHPARARRLAAGGDQTPQTLANLDALRAAGADREVAEPTLAAYRLRTGGHSQLGLVGDLHVADARHGRLRPHELTELASEDALRRQREQAGADTSPITVAYPPRPALAAMLAELSHATPDLSITTPDGVGHDVWLVTAPETVAALVAEVAALDAVYLLDGHHRLAAAARHADAVEEADSGAGDPGRVLAVLFAYDQVRVLDYRRVVRRHPDPDAATLLDEVRRRFAATPVADPGEAQPRRRGEMALRLARRWYRLAPHADVVAGPLPDRLDEAVVQRHLLDAVLGIADPRRDPALTCVPGTVPLDELCDDIDPDDVVVVLHPPRPVDVQTVADAGAVLPPKSTCFTPKPAPGLLVQARRLVCATTSGAQTSEWQTAAGVEAQTS